MKHRMLALICAAAFACLWGCGKNGDERGQGDDQSTAASWPVFRGSAGLTGIAEGSLPDNPKLLWTFKTQYEIKSSPVVGLKKVFIGSNDGYVYALDLESGSKIWAFNTEDDVEAAPLLVDSIVYVGSIGGFFYALKADDGQLLWQYETGGQIHGSANYMNLPEGDDILVMVGSYDNLMYGFDGLEGTLKWTYETDYYINGSPAVGAKLALFGGCDEIIHIISVRDGKKVGEVEAGAYIAGSAALYDDMAYIGHYGDKLIAIDVQAKKILWEYGEKKKGAAFFSSPAVNEAKVIIGSRDRLVHCVDRKSGRQIWTFRTRGDVDSSPVICHNKVVVGSNDGRIYILDIETGSMLWSYETGAAISGSPAVTAGKIIVGADDGVVYTFGESR